MHAGQAGKQTNRDGNFNQLQVTFEKHFLIILLNW
jgi:hypothetical protein